MQLLDYAVVVLWLILTMVAGTYFSRRASESTDSFFLSGRALPWWLVGTSMVATTFAADTPLVVAGWVASKGIAENWVWWTLGFSGPLAVFYVARLWRRAGIVTDAELVELRYGAPLGTGLRALKAVWFGVFMNVLVIAWVMGAMTRITATLMGVEGAVAWGIPVDGWIVLGLFLLTAGYTSASGLFGVVATDLLQFFLAMGSSIGLGVLAWQRAGGRVGIEAAYARHGLDWEAATALVPPMGGGVTGDYAAWILMIGVVWWSQTNVEGGGYLAQRLFAARDERHAVWAYLWFVVAHITLRPWPWIAVGLAGVAMFGPTEDPEGIYPRVMMAVLSPGWLGLMVAAFLAAFMSTIDTQLHWGASMVVHDLYRRFSVKDTLESMFHVRFSEAERHHLWVSRLAVLGIAALGAVASFAITDIGGAWKLAISVTAGLGTVYLARWYWWRVNAWSEIAAMGVAAALTLGSGVLAARHPEAGGTWNWLSPLPAVWLRFPFSTAWTVAVSVPTWVAVTYATAPAKPAVLMEFYRRVRPGGPGWRAVAGHLPGFPDDGPSWSTLIGMLSAWIAVFGALIATGSALLGKYPLSAGLAATALVGAVFAGRQIRQETGRAATAHPDML